ncbi:MAG: radical SAM protein [Clostridia bacterium]|nr:radical SAM protein [Clostridia bacterium]
MKKSKYNYIFKNKEKYILFNTVSGSVVVLNKEFYYRFKQGTLSETEIQTLAQLGFLVENNVKELNRILDKNFENFANQDTKIYTICPTTQCNARCFYCFEHGKQHFTMTKEIAEQVINFIKDDTKKSGAKNVCLSWFGGEPLLETEIIDFITTSLLNDDEFIKNINFEAKITTNGILIDEKVLNKLIDWKISTIQITLDGFKKEYERRKAYINEKNAFEKIISIIKQVSEKKIYVKIRLNFDNMNFDSINELINYLSFELTENQRKFIKIYPAKLENTQKCTMCNSHCDKNYVKLLKQLHKNNLSLPFEQLNLKYRFAHCLAESQFSYVIGADGNLYKCNEAVDDKQHSVGNVFDGVIKEILNRQIDSKCKRCKFFPICQGGCFIRENKTDSCAKCQIEKFIISDILKLYT